ncbi:Hypothetical_protein [Hexamita inflata]|uniref:Hypothetical_protein n=1 Tax=Hexamita inflata TaxID=28002 RepID=A0AA86QGF0_9EUKA|nr:Hypothetical protein HINF_LOCUS38815 [Hexamita inflata]
MTYSDYNSCERNCENGICELSYNSFLKINEYVCKVTSYDLNSFWWFMIIPGMALLLLIILCCCCNDAEDETSKVKHVDTEAVLVPTQQKNPATQKTKVNQNVTGIATQGQQVTLPNGQVGIFIALTQPQQDQVRQVQAIQQAPQFYQPQPIYQNKGQQVYGQTIEMPQMPNMM